MIAQKAVGQRFVFAQQAQQQVLRLYIGRTELAGLVSRKEDNAPCFRCILLEHMPLTHMPPVTSAGNISLPPRGNPRFTREEAFCPASASVTGGAIATPNKPAVCRNRRQTLKPGTSPPLIQRS